MTTLVRLHNSELPEAINAELGRLRRVHSRVDWFASRREDGQILLHGQFGGRIVTFLFCPGHEDVVGLNSYQCLCGSSRELFALEYPGVPFPGDEEKAAPPPKETLDAASERELAASLGFFKAAGRILSERDEEAYRAGWRAAFALYGGS